jgi:hypothetical protein
MAPEINENLENTLQQVDQWLYYRFDENYTAKLGEELKEKVLPTVSTELREEDRIEIAKRYGKNEMSEIFEGHFTRQYAGLELLFNNTDEEKKDLTEKDKEVVDKVEYGFKKITSFID